MYRTSGNDTITKETETIRGNKMQYDGFYDVHIHLLPGVDDGSKSMEMTIEMLKRAYEQGVRNLIATPHYVCGRKNASYEKRSELLEDVKKEASKIADDLNIYMGNELYYSEGIIEELKEGRAATMCGSKYVLVEFPTNIPYKELYRGMRRFFDAGYRPILAHVERYDCLYKNMDQINELLELGSTVQMNAESLIGGFLDGRASFCRKVLTQGMVHLLGSDAHAIEYRAPIMLDTVRFLEKKHVSEDLLERILVKNPQKIIENEIL